MSFSFDLQSVFFVNMLINLIIAITMVLYWRTQKTYPGFGQWTVADVLIALNYLLAVIGIGSHNRFLVCMASACLVVGVVSRCIGVYEFFDKRYPVRATQAVIVCVVLGYIYMAFVPYNTKLAQMILGTIVIAYYCALIAYTMFKWPSYINRKISRIISGVHVIYILIMSIRAVAWIVYPSTQGGLTSSIFNYSFFVVQILLDVFMALALITLNSQRLANDLNKSQMELNHLLSARQEVLQRLVDEKTKDLQASEAKVRALIEAVPDMLVVSTREGLIEEIYINASFNIVFSKESLQGKTIHDALPKHIAEEIIHLTQKVIDDKKSEHYEFTLHAEHEIKYLRTRTMRLNSNQAFHIVTDITEHKRLEAQMLGALSQLQEAQKLSTAGIMAASIAHDLSQPLNSIKVSTSGLLYLSESGAELSMEKVISEINRISRQVERIGAVVNNVRNVVRQEPYSRSYIVLETALALSLDAFKSISGNDRIPIQYRKNSSNSLIFAATSEIEQIVFNLLKNAQEVLIASARSDKEIVVSTSAKGQGIEFSISDNGGGIAENVLPRVFDPFFTTKKHGADNLGFGLAIVKSLTESLGGNIYVYNNEIGGATFTIRLPIERSRV